MKDVVELKSYLDAARMTRYQWSIVAVCVLLYIIDGFDILVMAFTANSISQGWGLSGSEIGLLISSGLGGAAFGSFFVAPLGDKVGRKAVIVISMGFASISMLLSSYAGSALELGCLRFITGVCIGGVLTNCNVIASEYSSLRWKSLAVCLLSTGYAIGATFGGLLAMSLDKQFGWKIVFLIGGLMSMFSLVVAIVALPESLYFLINRKPKTHLRKIQVIGQKICLPNISLNESARPVENNTVGNLGGLFKGEVLTSTILLWVALYSLMFGFYYILTWTPRILASSGLTNEQGISAGVVINFGAIIGTILFGFLGARFKIASLQVFFLVLPQFLWFFLVCRWVI